MKKILVIMLILLTAAGCVPASPTPLPATAPASGPNSIENGYPVTQSQPESYPADQKSQPLTGVPVPPTSAPQPQPGKASVSGVFYSYTVDTAITGTGFYLTPAQGEDANIVPAMLTGPSAEAGDIEGFSDDKGEIALDNVPPGNYFLIVWAPMNWSIAKNSQNREEPLLIHLEEGQQAKLGVIYLSWP